MKRMVYVVEDVTSNRIYDLFYSFCESSAEQFARWHRDAQMTRAEARWTDTTILGWEIETECGDAQKAFSDFIDQEIDARGFVRYADFCKEILESEVK